MLFPGSMAELLLDWPTQVTQNISHALSMGKAFPDLPEITSAVASPQRMKNGQILQNSLQSSSHPKAMDVRGYPTQT